MQTISNAILDSVTGGTGSIPGGSASAGAATTPTLGTGLPGASGLTGCGGLTGALASLNSAIKGLNSNNDGFNSTDMLMLGMAMMFSRPEYGAAAVPVFVGGGFGGFGGFGGGCGGCHGGRW
jgi:hypothetical protein